MSTRKEILEKLAAGEIDVTRATELLSEARDAQAGESAFPDVPEREDDEMPEIPPVPAVPPQPAYPPVAPRAKSEGWRWLRIQVSDLDSGRSRVRVNVPLGLVKFGMRIGARFTDELDNETMQHVLTALESGEIEGTLVEVEDVEDNERVHIYVE